MILNFTYPSSAQYTGGVVVLYEFANAMARRGHEVHFIHGPAWPHRIDHLDELSWFPFDPRVHQHLVDSLDDPSLRAGDVVFSHRAPRRLGERVAIVQGHGLVSPELDREVFRAPVPKLCVARWLVEVGVAYGAPRAQMLHVPMGLDHSLFRPRTPQHARAIDVAVLYNAHPAKGWGIAQRSLELVRERRPGLKAVAFGVLPPGFALPGWIGFHRGLDRAALVAEIYDRSKVFLQPSWYEGFGFTAVEAMATGCALVTTDNGGSEDYAEHGATAIVAPPGDAEALAAGIEDLLSDLGLRRAIGAAGERYVRRFDWDNGAQIMEDHLLRYLADPAALQGAPGDGDGPPPRRVGTSV